MKTRFVKTLCALFVCAVISGCGEGRNTLPPDSLKTCAEGKEEETVLPSDIVISPEQSMGDTYIEEKISDDLRVELQIPPSPTDGFVAVFKT